MIRFIKRKSKERREYKRKRRQREMFMQSIADFKEDQKRSPQESANS